MSLERRLLTSHLLTSLVPLAIVGGASYLIIAGGLRDRAVSSLAAVADGQSARVTSVVEQNAERLALVASRTQLRISLRRHLRGGDDAETQRMRRILGDALRSIGDFERIRVLDPAGRVVVAVPPMENTASLPVEDLERALAGPVLDSVRRLPDGAWNWQLAGPLTLDGETLGVIVVDSSLAKIESAVASVRRLGASARTHVLAGRAHEAIVTGGPLAAHPGALLATTPRVGEIEVAGVPRTLAVQRVVQRAGLHIVVTIDRAEVFEGVRMLTLVLAGSLVVVVVVIVVMALRLTSSVADPLTRLARAAARLGSGDFKTRADVEVVDEIRVLTDAFNEMAVRVASMNQELEDKVRARTEEVRRANERLGHVVAMQNAILTSADAAIVMTDAGGTITLFNPAAERLLGYASAEVVGRLSILDLHDREELAAFPSPGGDDGDVRRLFRAAEASDAAPDAPRRREWTYVRKDGSPVRVLVALAPVGAADAADEKVRGHLAIVTPID